MKSFAISARKYANQPATESQAAQRHGAICECERGHGGKALLRNRSYALWLNDADVKEEAVVLEVVRDDDVALLFPCQHILHVVLNVATVLDKSGVDVAGGEVDDGEAVLQVTDDADNLVVALLFLEHGDELRHAERRDVEPFAREGVEIVQTVGILLEPGIATVATHEDIGVHEDVVWVKVARLVSHGSEH